MQYFKILLLAGILTPVLLISGIHKNQRPQPFTGKLDLSVDPYYLQIVNQVSYDSIYSYLQTLQSFGIKEPGTQALNNTRDWIQQKMFSYGYTDVVYHDFNYNSHTLQNIITTKAGLDYPTRYLIIDGHYDTINGPGVNDNGSGTAIILEVARLLASVDCGISIRFINFSAEEEGLIGSSAYVNNVVVPQNMDILLVLNIDEVGGVAGMTNNTVTCERDEGNPPGNNAASAAYTDTLATLTQLYSSLNTQIAHAYASDYMPFEDAGYVITGFFEANESPYPHSPDDILANMDPAYVTEIARATVAAALYFARARTVYLNLFHEPVAVVQDTTHPYPVQLKIVSSSVVTTAQMAYRVNGGNFFSETLSFQFQNGDTLFYEGEIPAQPYYSQIDYFFTAVNQDSVASRLPQDSSEYFTILVLPDTVGPALQHQPPDDISYLMQPLEFLVTATDENEIQAVNLMIHKNQEPEQVLPMQRTVGNTYQIFFNEPLVPGDSLFYRFEATDNSPNHNITRLPESGYFALEVLNSLLYDFEIDAGFFIGSGDWQWGELTDGSIPTPVGTHVWATNLQGNYSPNSQSELLTPAISLTDKQDVQLVISHFYRIEPINDGGNVKISVDGAPFQLIMPEGGYPYANLYLFNEPGYSGNSYFWLEERFDLSGFTGQNIQMKLDFRSDVFTQQKGWYIDWMRLDFRGGAVNYPPQFINIFPMTLDTLLIGSQQTFRVLAEDPNGDSLLYQIQHRDSVVYDSVATFRFQEPGADTVVALVDDQHGHILKHIWEFFVYDPALAMNTSPGPIPVAFRLHPPFPNPFNATTTIRFDISRPSHVTLRIFNLLGEEQATLLDDHRQPGEYRLTLNANGWPSGLYFVVMEAGAAKFVQRFLLIK